MLAFFGLDGWFQAVVALVSGTALGFVYGLVPGIGGRVGIVLSLPAAALFPPYEAAIFLFAMHSVINTSSSIPNIAFGIPESSSDMATVIDGHPLAKMGRGGEALGASLSASAIGGVLGALAFLAAIPIARPLVTSFGPPEFLMLAVFGLMMVASLSQEGLVPGLAVGMLGILTSTVGIDFRTGEPRYAFGWLELWGGVGLPAIVCGLFVIPEMLSLRTLDGDSHRRATTTTIADVFRGMFVTLRYMKVTLRSTLYGILIGLVPSLGSSLSVWMSYDYAARTVRSEIPFGKGAIAGVIAPEAANNSKEGGAMIPTLFFGIPGSSSMAIMMGALAYVGLAVGPDLLGKNIGLSYALAATVFLANLAVVPMFFVVIPSLIRLSALRREAIAPVAIVISVTAALIALPQFVTIVLISIGTLIGVGLKLAGWPRAPFILGYVVGTLAETSYFHTVQIYGWSALSRPITLGLAVFTIGWIIHVLRTRPVSHMPGPRMPTIATSIGLAALFVVAIVVGEVTILGPGRIFPVGVSVVGACLCVASLVFALRSEDDPPVEPMRHGLYVALFIGLTPVIGLPLATAGFASSVLISIGLTPLRALGAALALVALQLLLLWTVFDILVEREVVGRIVWALLGY